MTSHLEGEPPCQGSRRRNTQRRWCASTTSTTQTGGTEHARRDISVRAYSHAIDDFIDWYSSEPRLAFSRPVVLRYRIELESRHLSASTINLRLAAVRRLAYEAADNGLLSPELAAGIQRVKGAKRLGVRLGNWLTLDHCRLL